MGTFCGHKNWFEKKITSVLNVVLIFELFIAFIDEKCPCEIYAMIKILESKKF